MPLVRSIRSESPELPLPPIETGLKPGWRADLSLVNREGQPSNRATLSCVLSISLCLHRKFQPTANKRDGGPQTGRGVSGVITFGKSQVLYF